MRPGQNKRMRGRNPNRKGPNPLTRSYESNGPDVKIRGTAHHVAEKYLQLARDAQSSGDPVAAESYLQHAEHYFRLIATAQLVQAQAQMGYERPAGEADVDDDDDDDFSALPDRFASPPERTPAPTPQPYNERPPYNGGGDRQNGYNGARPQQGGEQRPYNGNAPYGGGERQQGGDRGQYDRQGGQDRAGQDRTGQDRSGQDQRPAQERFGQDRNDRQGGYNNNGGERYGRDRNGMNRNNQRSQNRDYQPRGEFQPRDMGTAEQPVVRDPPREPGFQPAQEIRPQVQAEARLEAPAPQAESRQPESRPAPVPQVETGPALPAFITAPTRAMAPPRPRPPPLRRPQRRRARPVTTAFPRPKAARRSRCARAAAGAPAPRWRPPPPRPPASRRNSLVSRPLHAGGRRRVSP